MVLPLLGEREDAGGEHVVHCRWFLLLCEHHRQIEQEAHHDGRGDAAGLNGQYLVDVRGGITTDELHGDSLHEVRVHLMIDKLVYLEYSTWVALSIFENTVPK